MGQTDRSKRPVDSLLAEAETALGQVQPPDGSKAPGSMWIVPVDLYEPIRQDVVVLTDATSKTAATAFAKYLAGDKARATIRAYGYAW